MRCELWPGNRAVHTDDIDRYYNGPIPGLDMALVAEDQFGALVGFAELAIRPHAEGCEGHRVGYLEGWYTDQSARRRGVGRALVAAAEDWARSQECTELASDTELANLVSAEAHRAIGFENAGTVLCFRKSLRASTPAPPRTDS